MLSVPRVLYRRRLGWLLGRRFVLLEHVGRTSGRHYETVLEVLSDDRSSGEVAVMAGWGQSSDWFRNVTVAGKARVTVGRRTSDVGVRVLDEAQAERVVAEYERRNWWMRPIVRRMLGRLSGLTYDGSLDSRRAIVRRLPLVAFTPLPPRDV